MVITFFPGFLLMGGHFTRTMLAACVDLTKSAHHVFKINLLISECSKPSTNTPNHTIPLRKYVQKSCPL